MEQNDKYVRNLQKKLNVANATVSAQIDEIVKLNKEREELHIALGQCKEALREEEERVEELERQLGLRTVRDEGQKMAQTQIKRSATRRAHKELHKVKPTETNTALLHRAIGNAQGILAAVIDSNFEESGLGADPISLYPEDENRELSEQKYAVYRRF